MITNRLVLKLRHSLTNEQAWSWVERQGHFTVVDLHMDPYGFIEFQLSCDQEFTDPVLEAIKSALGDYCDWVHDTGEAILKPTVQAIAARLGIVADCEC